MQSLSPDTRRSLGCGYEPASEDAHPWAPPLGAKGYRGKLPTICAGYTTRLPEVTEIARAHYWSGKNALHVVAGTEPSDLLLLGVEILDGAMARVRVWAMTPKKDGGGLDS